MFRQSIVALTAVGVLGSCSWNKDVQKATAPAPNPRIVERSLVRAPAAMPSTQPVASNDQSEKLQRELEQARQDLARLRSELESAQLKRSPTDIAADLNVIGTRIAGIEATVFRVPFKFDSSQFEVSPEAGNALVSAAKKASKVELRGRTDGIGDLQYNLKMALARANAARTFLIQRGVSPEALEVNAQGDGDYIASNKTRVGRAQNRRVDIVITRENAAPVS